MHHQPPKPPSSRILKQIRPRIGRDRNLTLFPHSLGGNLSFLVGVVVERLSLEADVRTSAAGGGSRSFLRNPGLTQTNKKSGVE
jgi:hypothetical protein